MTIAIGGTLGDISQTVQAKKAEPEGINGTPKHLVDAWTKVSDYMRANPSKGVIESLKACEVPNHIYYAAKRKMECNEKPARGSSGAIRPEDPIVRNTKSKMISCDGCGLSEEYHEKNPWGLPFYWSYGGDPTQILCPPCDKKRRDGMTKPVNRDQTAIDQDKDDDDRRRRVEEMQCASDQRAAENDDGGIPDHEVSRPEGPNGIGPSTENLDEEMEDEEAEEPPLPEDVLREVMAWLRQLPVPVRPKILNAARVLCGIEEDLPISVASTTGLLDVR